MMIFFVLGCVVYVCFFNFVSMRLVNVCVICGSVCLCFVMSVIGCMNVGLLIGFVIRLGLVCILWVVVGRIVMLRLLCIIVMVVIM